MKILVQSKENNHKREIILALIGVGIILLFGVTLKGFLPPEIVGVTLLVAAISLPFLILYRFAPQRINVLIWKEIMETRPIWLVAFCFIVLIPLLFSQLIDITYTGVALFFLLIYCPFLGARTFAGERDQGTLDYLQTRPVHPLWVLLVKYMLGLIQISTLLLIVIYFSTTDQGFQFIIGKAYDKVTSPLIVSTFFISLYSFCFFVSIFVQDTVRAFLIGFPGTVIVDLVFVYINLKYQYGLGVSSTSLQLLQECFSLVNLNILLLGIIGITYYRVYYKRWVWKTGFLVFFPLAFYLMYYSNNLFYGDMNPVSTLGDFRFTNGSYNADQIYYWNGKIFGFDFLYGNNNISNSSLRLNVIDVNNPQHPVGNTVMKMPPSTWLPYFDFQNNKLYTIEKIWTGPPNDNLIKSWGAQSTQRLKEHRSDRPRLVVWDISDLDHPKELARVKFVTETTSPTYTRYYEKISVDDRFINVGYTFEAGRIYYIENGRLGRKPTSIITNHFKTLNKTRVVQIDKKNFQIVNQFDEKFQENNWPFIPYQVYGHYEFEGSYQEIYIYDNSDSIHRPYSLKFWGRQDHDSLHYFVIRDHYLYVRTEQHPLIIYDITDALNPKIIGETNWDWIDAFDLDRNYGQSSRIIIKNNRAIIMYNRGFLVFDISNPHHPKQIAKMTSDLIQTSVMNDGYLYAEGLARGFSIYRIP